MPTSGSNNIDRSRGLIAIGGLVLLICAIVAGLMFDVLEAVPNYTYLRQQCFVPPVLLPPMSWFMLDIPTQGALIITGVPLVVILSLHISALNESAGGAKSYLLPICGAGFLTTFAGMVYFANVSSADTTHISKYDLCVTCVFFFVGSIGVLTLPHTPTRFPPHLVAPVVCWLCEGTYYWSKSVSSYAAVAEYCAVLVAFGILWFAALPPPIAPLPPPDVCVVVTGIPTTV